MRVYKQMNETHQHLPADDDSTTLSRLQKFQALWRGYRVRKKLLGETRAEFEAIFTEIEQQSYLGNGRDNSSDDDTDKLQVFWKSMLLCMPDAAKAIDIAQRHPVNSVKSSQTTLPKDHITSSRVNDSQNITSFDSPDILKEGSRVNQGSEEDISNNGSDFPTQCTDSDRSANADNNVGVCCEFGTQTEDTHTADNRYHPENEPVINDNNNNSNSISPINISDATEDGSVLSERQVTRDSEKPSGMRMGEEEVPRKQNKPMSEFSSANLAREERSVSPLQCSTPVSSARRNLHQENTFSEKRNSKTTPVGKNLSSKKNAPSTTTLNSKSENNSPLRSTAQSPASTAMSKDGDHYDNILTESWMTDKSFSVVASKDTLKGDEDIPRTSLFTSLDGLTKETPSCFGSLDCMTREEICKQKEDLTLELLWIKQAIKSRKQYLEMKNERS